MARIRIELFGVPRLRAGVAQVELEAETVAEALRGLVEACPALRTVVVEGESLLPSFRLSLNSDQFINDPSVLLTEGDTLLLIAADAGG